MTKALSLIIAATLFLSLFRLGNAPLFDVDEAVFAEATREMVGSGNWITPTYNEKNRYDKPILFYWLMAASYKAFGINEFGARFPSALASFLLVLSIFLFARRLRGEKAALYAAGSSALSVYFLVYSHAAVTDITLTLFITLSLFSFFLSITGDPGKNSPYQYGFYLFSSLAFLTKGLIGILFPFSVAIIYTTATEGWRGAKRCFNPKGLLLFTAIAAPWYTAQVAINGREFIEQFFLKHHFRRFTGVISGHKAPIYYYIPVLLIGMFPWVAFLPSGIRDAWKGKRGVQFFALIWLAFIFVFFSLSVTKLPNYILPAMPAAALLIASGMTEKDIRRQRYSHIIMASLAAVLSAALLISGIFFSRKFSADTQWIFLAAAVVAMMTIPALSAIFQRKTLFVPVSCLMAAFLLVLLARGVPAAGAYIQGTLYKYSLHARAESQSGAAVIAYRMNNPSIAFYSGQKKTDVRSKDELLNVLSVSGKAVAIAKTKDIGTLEESGFHILEREGKYAILER